MRNTLFAAAALVALFIVTGGPGGCQQVSMQSASIEALRGAPSQVPSRTDRLLSAQIARQAPAVPDELFIFTKTVGTSAGPLFTTDLAAGLRTRAYVQNLRITNRHANQTVCVWFPLFATSCEATCTATAKTCAGTSGDGDPILPASSYTIPVTGDACACAVATGSGTVVSSSRVGRDPR
jgi:hypothetical protein